MKKITLFVLISLYLITLSAALFAQPVLVSTMTPFPVGTTDSIYGATASVAPGSGGAGVTWNLSGLTPVAEGTITVVNPASTPYFSTFPTATFCAEVNPSSGGSAYIYERLSSSKWEQLANNYSGVGTGTDYTPDPETAVEFPMSYLNSVIDTFQKVGGSANTVTITYDGYGTLITPFGTYTNVVRIYKYWGPGDYDYNWYVTSPNLDIVLSFDMQSNAYTFIRTASTTAIKEVSAKETAQIYPNPLTNSGTLKISAPNGLYNAFLTVADATGRIVKYVPAYEAETTISRDQLCPGLYFYSVENSGLKIASGKLVIQ